MNPEGLHHFPIRVYYEDTDAGGVVYYANYLKFMERARTEWLRECGFEQDQMISEQQLIFAVKKVEVDYMKPARFNDALTVTSSINSYSGASIEFKQIIMHNNNKLCHGSIVVVSLDSIRFKPRRMFPELLEELDRVCCR